MTQGSPPPPPQNPSPLNYATLPLGPGFNWPDFFVFRTMITTKVIQILFWLFVGVAVLAGLQLILVGLFNIRQGGIGMIFLGMIWVVVSPIFICIQCEVLIVIFRINETLTDIKRGLEK